MIDVSKYKFEKIKEENENNVFTQVFYDKDKCVKYIRTTWNFNSFPELDKNEALSHLKSIFDYTFGYVGKIVPNCFKYILSDNSYEVLFFYDDDLKFMEEEKLNPLLSSLTMRIITDIPEDELEDASESELMSKILDKVYESDDVRNLVKSMYNKYEGREL